MVGLLPTNDGEDMKTRLFNPFCQIIATQGLIQIASNTVQTRHAIFLCCHTCQHLHIAKQIHFSLNWILGEDNGMQKRTFVGCEEDQICHACTTPTILMGGQSCSNGLFSCISHERFCKVFIHSQLHLRKKTRHQTRHKMKQTKIHQSWVGKEMQKKKTKT